MFKFPKHIEVSEKDLDKQGTLCIIRKVEKFTVNGNDQEISITYPAILKIKNNELVAEYHLPQLADSKMYVTNKEALFIKLSSGCKMWGCIEITPKELYTLPSINDDIYVFLGEGFDLISPSASGHIFLVDAIVASSVQPAIGLKYDYDAINETFKKDLSVDIKSLKDQGIGIYKLLNPSIGPQPKNNDGRSICFKCGMKTEERKGFRLSIYNICPRCKI